MRPGAIHLKYVGGTLLYLDQDLDGPLEGKYPVARPGGCPNTMQKQWEVLTLLGL